MSKNVQWAGRLSAACLAALLLAACASAAAVGPARIQIASLAPLTVGGSGFQPRERVTIRVRVGEARSKRMATAGSGGRFRVAFSPFLAADLCRGDLLVVALGSKGSRATARRECRTPDPQS